MSELELTAPQRQFQNQLLEHAAAPRFNFTSTDMLTVDSLQEVLRFASESPSGFWAPGSHPHWLGDFVKEAFEQVPYYRAYGRAPREFETIPPWGREVLRDQPWSLVPDHLSLEALTVYTTSGTSGSALSIPTHPAVSSKLLFLIERLLSDKGVKLPRGAGQVAIALVACQQETLTYASVSQALDGAGFVKLNLSPHAWREPQHRAQYLQDLAPAVITGSPYSFEILSQVAPDFRPQALVSAAVALHDGHAAALSRHFGCPVFDLYSMTEARGIAGRCAERPEFALLSPDLYVEILGPDDQPLGEGEVGEIVLTGGRNPYFPLLRYRTGDRGALLFQGGQPYLKAFEGRQAVDLRGQDGKGIPTLDVVHALKALPLVGFSLDQDSDRSLRFEYCGACSVQQVTEPLEALFGGKVSVRQADSWDGKPHQFKDGPLTRPG